MNKTNILYVDQGLAFGGSFVVAARLASNLDQEKFSATILTSATLADIEHHAEKHVMLIYLRKHLTYKNRIDFLECLNARLNSKGISGVLRKLAIYSYSAIESIANLPYFLSICYRIIKHDIHIVHGNNALEAISAARLLRRKIVWHIHGDGLYSLREISHNLRRVDKFISISHFSASNAIHSGIAESDIVTIHNPTCESPSVITESKKIEMKKKYNISQESVVIGIFGRLVNWKGQLEFLRAAKHLAQIGRKVHFLIVGDDGEGLGEYTQELNLFVDAHSLRECVTFTGYVKNTDDYYQLCNIVVHASISPEPFGLVIVEAMKNGAAVIASNTGAAPELVEAGRTGLIADPNKAIELADAIAFLVDHPDIRAKYVQDAKMYVDLHMDPATYARQVEKLYFELI